MGCKKFKNIMKIIYANLGGGYFCPICNKNYNFLDFGNPYPIFLQKNIIGGGIRKKVRCPICDVNDRGRWCYYVLKNYTGIFEQTCSILHIAPEKGLGMLLKNIRGSYYVSGDICKGKADIVCNLTDMIFRDKSFDYIIVNHVLEHIENEEKAFEEMKRVLKKKGKIICSFPICLNDKTFELKGHDLSKEDRIKLYGQEDHVRLYGYDAKEHIEKYGIKVEEYITDQILSSEDFEKLRVIKNDRIFICTKID